LISTLFSFSFLVLAQDMKFDCVFQLSWERKMGLKTFFFFKYKPVWIFGFYLGNRGPRITGVLGFGFGYWNPITRDPGFSSWFWPITGNRDQIYTSMTHEYFCLSVDAWLPYDQNVSNLGNPTHRTHAFIDRNRATSRPPSSPSFPLPPPKIDHPCDDKPAPLTEVAFLVLLIFLIEPKGIRIPLKFLKKLRFKVAMLYI